MHSGFYLKSHYEYPACHSFVGVPGAVHERCRQAIVSEQFPDDFYTVKGLVIFHKGVVERGV